MRFTFLEKQMIHLTVTLQDYLNASTKEESLEIFGDMYEGELGSNSGEILYFQIADKLVALVHYWHGDNQYGAIFEINNGTHKLQAEINDGEITCK